MTLVESGEEESGRILLFTAAQLGKEACRVMIELDSSQRCMAIGQEVSRFEHGKFQLDVRELFHCMTGKLLE